MSIKTRLLISSILGLALTFWWVLSMNDIEGVSRYEIKDIFRIRVVIMALIPSVSIFMIVSLFYIENKKLKYLYLIYVLITTIVMVFFSFPYKTNTEATFYNVLIVGMSALIANFTAWIQK